MALNAGERLVAEHNREHKEKHNFIKEQALMVGQESTLALEGRYPGDLLPTDQSYEIVSSEIRTAHDRDGTYRVIIISAIKEDVVESSAFPWQELVQSRQVRTTNKTRRWTITFTGAVDATSPLIGQKYSDITHTPTILSEQQVGFEPRIVDVGDIQQVTPNKSHITVTFESHWSVSWRSNRRR